MTLIVDTGGLLSVLDANQDDHEDFVTALDLIPGPRIVSSLVITELDHLVLDRYGRAAELSVMQEVEEAYQIAAFGNEDMDRALLTRYADLRSFDLADATCVVLAERYDCFDILTTDVRDFRNITGSRVRHFRLIPYDL